MNRWRLPLRIARRDAQRARGRSILMLVMIALPVLGVTAADVLIQTQDVNSVESLDRRLGTEAAAKVYGSEDPAYVQQQGIDPDRGGTASGGEGAHALPATTLPAVLAALGGQRPALKITESYPSVTTRKGRVSVSGTEVDLRDPLSRGLYRLASGRWPSSTDEVVINQALRDRVDGDTITLRGDPDGPHPDAELTRTVVGIAESSSNRSFEEVAGLPGSLVRELGVRRGWLIGGGPVSWEDVKKLNAIGALVVSRSVIAHPSAQARADEARWSGPSTIDQATVTVAILVVVMSLIEVVLLAGPAFAVGARRQARPLALLAACGGTPQQARRVVLATGVVIGSVGATGGVVLGIGIARALQPVLQQFNDTWFGPFQVPWLHLLGIAAFGFVSALIAAVVPAWIASRQDVVAVLAGRRGDRKPSSRSPYIGVVLFVVGLGTAWLGTRSGSVDGANLIAFSAILCVLGMLFLIPVVVVAVARLGRRLPLALRFAVRDAARHRSRTTPAIAAVAATVAGVVALGIGSSSDEAENRGTYHPQLAMGAAAISPTGAASAKVDWDGYLQVLGREVPDAVGQRVRGVPFEAQDGTSHSVSFAAADGSALEADGFGGSVATDLLVYDGELPDLVTDLPGFDATAAKRVLDAGGVVVFSGGDTERPQYTGKVRVVVQRYSMTEEYDAEDGGSPDTSSTTVPGTTAQVDRTPPVQAIVAAPVAAKLGLGVADVGLTVSGASISKDQEKNLQEALNALPVGAYLYVERGYQSDAATWIIQLVLAALGAVLMLGGTLTATFLALSDARPDLATLSAIGAAPRTRRAVAAAYALAVGGIGAVLGVLVGFVPGLAITVPLTTVGTNDCYGTSCPGAHSYLDVPWLLIGGLVVVLPLLVSGIVWVAARSRLPLVSRLS